MSLVTEEGRPTLQLENASLGWRSIGWRKAVSWWLLALGAGAGVIGYPDSMVGPVALASIGGTLLPWYYAASWSNLWSPPDVQAIGGVRVDEKSLSVEAHGKRFSILLDRIGTRTAWQDRRGFITHFKAKNGDAITVVHERPEAAQALLQAAGERVHLDRMRLTSWVQRGSGREALLGLALFGCTTMLPVVLIAGAVALMSAESSTIGWWAFGAVATLMVAALVYLLDRAVAEPEMTAGADGLHLRGAVARRFVRFKDLDAASLDPHGIRLAYRHGKSELLGMWRHGMMTLPDNPEVDQQERHGPLATELLHKRARILERIQAGIAAKGQTLLGDAQLALLDRKGRPAADWRSAMDALLARSEGGYREVRLDPDALARVAENPAQPPDRRIGAALALSRVEDPHVQRRLRFAVETCVDERLRVTLDRATRGEIVDEELALIEADAAAQSERAGARR